MLQSTKGFVECQVKFGDKSGRKYLVLATVIYTIL